MIFYLATNPPGLTRFHVHLVVPEKLPGSTRSFGVRWRTTKAGLKPAATTRNPGRSTLKTPDGPSDATHPRPGKYFVGNSAPIAANPNVYW